MKCPKCGTENAPGRVLCVKCGTRLRAGIVSGAAAASPEAAGVFMQRLRGDLRRLVVVFIIVVAAAGALGLLLR
jgi:uncharacterized membrane protein YvbJ